MLEVRSAFGFLVHTPFGPRKSGMPLSVEIPAPVSTVTRRAGASVDRARSNARSVTSSVAPVSDPIADPS